MCLYPKLIKNQKYIANKKNGGIIPAINDNRVLMVPVGCQKCIECRKKKAREWQVRLLEEVKNNKNGIFITLTFSNESIKKLNKEIEGLSGYELDNQIATLATRRFLERWRKKYKKSLRHWLVTELGHNGTENIHMHGLVFPTDEMKKKDNVFEEINKIWGYGYTWIGDKKENYVSERTVNYIIKYINKIDKQHTEYNSKILTSAGIGKGYAERIGEYNSYKKEETREYIKTKSGHKIALPIYYRNKIYTDEEREKLWIEKLDKNERYVLGQKIDISENDKTYWNVLKRARQKNKRLGYGDDSINWERKKYENERRILMLNKRTQATTKEYIEPQSEKEEVIQPSKNWE